MILALGTNDNKTAVQDSYADGTVPFASFVEAPRYMINQIRQMHGQNVKIVILQNMMTGSWRWRAATLKKISNHLAGCCLSLVGRIQRFRLIRRSGLSGWPYSEPKAPLHWLLVARGFSLDPA